MLFFLALSCEKEITRLDDMFLEFATAVKSDSKTLFRLDNNRLLIPIDSYDNKAEHGKRVIINYTPVKGDTVKVNQVSSVFLGTVAEEQTGNMQGQDPVKIQSVWVSGGYLNMIFEAEYHSKIHKIGLYRNNSVSLSDLYFTYSREGDPPGYAKKVYASFMLSALYEDNPPTNKFTLNIKTVDGIRQFDFELSSVRPIGK